jgi:hypothetical protein
MPDHVAASSSARSETSASAPCTQKRPCLPGTARAWLEVTQPPGRCTGRRILVDSAFGWLNDELLQMVGFWGHEGFHTGNPVVHVRAAPTEQINVTTAGTKGATRRL